MTPLQNKVSVRSAEYYQRGAAAATLIPGLLLILLLVALVLSLGSIFGRKPTMETLKEDAPKIAVQKMLALLDTNKDQSDNVQFFFLEDNHIVEILPKEDLAERNSKGAVFAKTYIVWDRKIELKKTEPIGIKKQDGEYIAYIELEFEETINKRDKKRGVALHKLYPLGSDHFTGSQFSDFKKEYFDLLPGLNFDIKEILKQKGRTQIRKLISIVEVRWDKEASVWTAAQLTFKKPEDLNIPRAEWTSDEYSQDKLIQKLAASNIKLYDGVFYSEKDIEILEKIAAGNVYYEGGWVTKEVYTSTEAIRNAWRKFSKNRYWNDLRDVIKLLADKTDALEKFRKEITENVRKAILGEIEFFRKRKDLKQLQDLRVKMQQYQGAALIDENLFETQIAAAETEIKQEQEAEARRREEARQAAQKREQERIQEINQQAKQIAELIFTEDFRRNFRRNYSEYFIQRSQMQQKIARLDSRKYHEFLQKTDRYVYIIAVFANAEEHVSGRLDENDVQYVKSILIQTCRFCKDGTKICEDCKGTRKCKACGGRGYYYIPSISGGRDYRSCPSRCQSCLRPQLCRRCKGKRTVVNPDAARQYSRRLKSEIEELTSGF